MKPPPTPDQLAADAASKQVKRAEHRVIEAARQCKEHEELKVVQKARHDTAAAAAAAAAAARESRRTAATAAADAAAAARESSAATDEFWANGRGSWRRGERALFCYSAL